MAKLIIQIHGAGPMKEMLQKKPEESRYIAISKDKLASIFYKNIRGTFYMNSLNGLGWEIVRQKSEKELIKSLWGISFLMADIGTLESILSSMPIVLDEPVAMVKFESKVNAQFARITMRRDYDGDKSGYWQGQYDAFEIVQSMMRECA